MLSGVVSGLLLVWGFIFTFFLPGASLTELLFEGLPKRVKFLLYLALSVFASCFVVYGVSLVIGFTSFSILLSSAVFLPIFWLVRKNISETLKYVWSKHRIAVLTAPVIYILFWIALYPAIFTLHNGYLVMASVNWQDTAMHQSIIQTLVSGNFPPQAPYFAGVSLNYYYFVDFHTAILVSLSGGFFPRVLVWDNPAFAVMFFWAVYFLAFEVFGKKLLAMVSAVASNLFGSLMFSRFFTQLALGENWKSLLTNNSYSMEYEKLFQISNMADYFLQNRPMMFGLPVFIAILLLLLVAFKKQNRGALLLAGVMVGLLVKFQFFAVVVSLVAFGLLEVVALFESKISKTHLREVLLSGLVFGLPVLVLAVLLTPRSIGNQSFLETVNNTFSFGPWEHNQPFWWHLRFLLLNLGGVFVLGITPLLYRWERHRQLMVVNLLFILFVLFPYTVKFTIYKADMFKFFYFAVPLGVISAVAFLDHWLKVGWVKYLSLVVFVVICSTSSLLTLSNSFLNKSAGYSLTDVRVGEWIRFNTLPKSVFVTYPSVHTPVSDLGGRLRFLSYINWPHSHGFNTGTDNVFTRLADLKVIYVSQDDSIILDRLYNKHIDYIYYSSEEKREWGDSQAFFDSRPYLQAVYYQDGVVIYKVLPNFEI